MTRCRVVCLLAFALVLGATWRTRPKLAATVEEGLGAEQLAATDSSPRARAVASPPAAEERAPGVARAGRTHATTVLAPEEAALVAEQVLLQQRAAGSGLELTPEQWASFAAVTRHHQAIRHAYEATLARATVAGEHRVQLEIPAYPIAGDALRERLFADLGEKLGPAAASRIAQQAGSVLEGHFGGFGVSVQTLDFAREPGGGDGDYSVTRTVNYWNSTRADDRLTLRREVHFPALEDPTGHSWGPFLSVMASREPHHAGG